MTVYIVNFRGTIYGVFDSHDKARTFAEIKFGRNAIMALDVSILDKEVQ